MSLDNKVSEQKERLMLEAGRAMARRAVDDLTMSPEEKAARAAEDEAGKKKRLVKIVLGAVVGVVVVVGVLRLMAALWVYAILAAVVGGIGALGYFALQPKLEAMKQRRLADAAAAQDARTADARAAAATKAVADQKQKLDDELARLKRSI